MFFIILYSATFIKYKISHIDPSCIGQIFIYLDFYFLISIYGFIFWNRS